VVQPMMETWQLEMLEKTALLVKTQSRSTNVPAPEQLAPVKCAVVNNVGSTDAVRRDNDDHHHQTQQQHEAGH
jgi:hypothetical protein